MPAQAHSNQGVVVMIQPGRDDGDLQRVIWVAVVCEALGIDTELLVDMYFHMAEDVIVGRGNGLPPDNLLPLIPIPVAYTHLDVYKRQGSVLPAPGPGSPPACGTRPERPGVPGSPRGP